MTATLQKMPHVGNMGQYQKKHKHRFCRSITQLAGSRQARIFRSGCNFDPRRRALEKPHVFALQLSRARRQIKAYQKFGDISRWPEVATDE